jgi:hypothetical protein
VGQRVQEAARAVRRLGRQVGLAALARTGAHFMIRFLPQFTAKKPNLVQFKFVVMTLHTWLQKA